MTINDAKILIAEINKVKAVNDWEASFLNSLSSQIESGRKPTTAQSDKLQQIYRIAYGGGCRQKRSYL